MTPVETTPRKKYNYT